MKQMIPILLPESVTPGLSMSLVKVIKATYTIGVRLAGDAAIWALSKIETMTEKKLYKQDQQPCDHIHKDNDTV
tara:strand:+ start:78 stop:299 length:222 start_codon:yes stop_codon:yes gene_type:complete